RVDSLNDSCSSQLLKTNSEEIQNYGCRCRE
ncbi:hypothetical protein AVEN_162744-2-1, partial [Araneus ventricosus]